MGLFKRCLRCVSWNERGGNESRKISRPIGAGEFLHDKGEIKCGYLKWSLFGKGIELGMLYHKHGKRRVFHTRSIVFYVSGLFPVKYFAGAEVFTSGEGNTG